VARGDWFSSVLVAQRLETTLSGMAKQELHSEKGVQLATGCQWSLSAVFCPDKAGLSSSQQGKSAAQTSMRPLSLKQTIPS
jgi:hypothetical protein